MDIEMKDEVVVEADAQSALTSTVERLAAATGMLEQAVARMFERQGEFAMSAEASIGRIVATVESKRETELEQKLAAAEAEIAELRAAGVSACPVTITTRHRMPLVSRSIWGMATVPTVAVQLLPRTST